MVSVQCLDWLRGGIQVKAINFIEFGSFKLGQKRENPTVVPSASDFLLEIEGIIKGR